MPFGMSRKSSWNKNRYVSAAVYADDGNLQGDNIDTIKKNN
jgi:hypothetical protein